MKFCEGAGGDDDAPWRDEMEPDARANRDIREVVQGRNAHPEFTTNRTNHLAASEVRQDRRQKCVLLVPEPQSPPKAEDEAS